MTTRRRGRPWNYSQNRGRSVFPRPLEEGGELFQPPPPSPHARHEGSSGAPQRHRQSRWTRCASTGAHSDGPEGSPARQRREPSGCRLLFRFRPDLRLVTLCFVFFSERISHHASASEHRAWTYLHITRADRMPHPIIRSSQLSVSRTTCAHNRTRARSPPAL